MINLSNLTNVDESYETEIRPTYTIGYMYVIAPICMCGFVLNLTSLIMFFCAKIGRKWFRYFRAKTMAELLITGVGALMPMVTECARYNSYWLQIYRLVVNVAVFNVASTFCGLMQIIIVYDRYTIMCRAKKQLRLPRPMIITVFLILSVLLAIPAMFVKKIVRVDGGNFTLVTSESIAYLCFHNIYTFGRSVVFFVLLVICWIKLHRVYKKYMRVQPTQVHPLVYHLPVRENSDFKLINKQSIGPNLALMVLTSSWMFLIVTFLQSISHLFSVCEFFLNFNSTQMVYVNFAINTIDFVSKSVSFFFYFKFNKLFRLCFVRLVKRTFCIMFSVKKFRFRFSNSPNKKRSPSTG